MLNIKHTHIAGLILAGLLVGCGGGGSDSEGNEGTEQSQETNENNNNNNNNNNEQMEVEGNGGTGASDQPVQTPPPSTPSNAKMFTANVMPVLNAKCKSCHGSNGRFTITTPSATYANISDLKASVTEAGKYLYDKGSNTIGHGGDKVIQTNSAEYATIKSWVNSGADFN